MNNKNIEKSELIMTKKENQVFKICKILQFSAAEMSPNKKLINEFNQESINHIESLISEYDNDIIEMGYYSESLKQLLIKVYKVAKGNPKDSFYDFLERSISKELFCYRAIDPLMF